MTPPLLDPSKVQRKRKTSDSVLWPKPQYQQKMQKKQREKKWRHQHFDYTTIADRLKKVIWSNDSHLTAVVEPVYGIQTFPLTTKAV